jgi:hypothetical protein
MKKIDQLVFPKNLDKILDKDGIWSDDTFAPITVLVLEGEDDGSDVICYQFEIPVGDAFEEIEAIMESNDMDASGLDWEDMIREYIHRIDPILENKLQSESEAETCILWVPDETNFRKVFGHLLDLLGDLGAVKRLFA